MKLPLIFSIFAFVISCTTQKNFQPQVVYQSENLILTEILPGVIQHVSYLETESFGKVSCNGMILIDENQAIVVDASTNIPSSKELLEYFHKNQIQILGVVPTHFHEDCVAGLNLFHEEKIPSYANFRTIEILKNQSKPLPQIGFQEELTLSFGTQKLELVYLGQGHTRDNIVAYYPEKQILFGGCLLKEMGASKGNLEDTNQEEWPATIQKIQHNFPRIQIIIPGHGNIGGKELLEYTYQLFQK